MKYKKAMWIIIILVALILVGVLLSNKIRVSKTELKQEWKSCTSDSDCVLVSTLGCYSCGKDSVNSRFVEEYNNYRIFNTGSCEGIVATQCQPNAKAKIPRCVSNACVAAEE